ncbi:glycosyltransferase family 39 protein [Neolewinella litorea]|uniref:Glycosyltransferase RgtA/B/C/D-like domain-containing protein n=1 Tax=Neolewinella litorea TaxID=2562452 RepID=A0A4S4NS66_9BACT|nr:glycosyltransferase family 39 protein [Neolewinella litorea]THH41258.1 hypothetical protein E4021_01275 [Neolewinella litorea]
MNHRIFVGLFFLAFLATGFYIVDDYGITYDEAVQRRHGHVTVEYIADRLGVDHPPLATEGKSFSEYGMIFQIVGTVAEIHLGVIDDPYAYYRLRHVLGFLLFGIALAFFYRTLRLRWPIQRWYPLLGTAILVLSPRIFAHAFFNPKDHILLVFYLIATFTLVRFLKVRSWSALLWHVAASALALNTRFPALILVAATVALLVWEQLTQRPRDFRRLWQTALYLPGTFLLMLPFFPYLWVDTGSRLTGAISHMSAYTWDSVNLLFAEYLPAIDLPAYYIPAWIVITTPVVYLLFLFTGLYQALRQMLGGLRRWSLWDDFAQQVDFVHLGLSIGPILVVIILGSTLYNGWRHLHFVYPGLVYLMLLGYERLRRAAPILSAVVLGGGLLATSVAMVRMHPQQQVYFNAVIRGDYLLQRFDMDYWGAGYRQAFLELAKEIPEGESRRIKCQNWPCIDNIRALPPGVKGKIINESDWTRADYVATNFLYPEERGEVSQRTGHFARPMVEVRPCGNLIVGIYKLKE